MYRIADDAMLISLRRNDVKSAYVTDARYCMYDIGSPECRARAG